MTKDELIELVKDLDNRVKYLEAYIQEHMFNRTNHSTRPFNDPGPWWINQPRCIDMNQSYRNAGRKPSCTSGVNPYI